MYSIEERLTSAVYTQGAAKTTYNDDKNESDLGLYVSESLHDDSQLMLTLMSHY